MNEVLFDQSYKYILANNRIWLKFEMWLRFIHISQPAF